MQKLEYLNLELPKNICINKKATTFNINCNNLHGDHSLTSPDPSINSILDLLINLGRNLEYIIPKNQNFILSTIEKICKTNLGNKLDFIQKHLESFDNKLNSFPSTKDIRDFYFLLEAKPKQLDLEIKKSLNQFQEEINSIKTVQDKLQKQLEDIKTLVDRG